MLRVTFLGKGNAPEALATVSGKGRTLLQAAHDAGVEVAATCGGRGRCRTCRVKVVEGDLPPPSDREYAQLGPDEVNERFRLACQTRVAGNCSVVVAPPTSEVGYRVLVHGAGLAEGGRTSIESGIEQRVVTAAPPSLAGAQRADSERATADLPDCLSRDLPLEVLRDLPAVLRHSGGRISFTTFNGSVIDVQAGDASAGRYGMAFDVGTTTVVGTLLDLDTGQRLASVARANPQATHGGDLMSRIAFAQGGQRNFAKLRGKIVQTLNDFVIEACRDAGIEARHVYKIVIVGNTCMHHILLGIDVTELGLAPYAPVTRAPLVLPASELPLKTAPKAKVCLLPLVAGFVGSDAVAAMLATRFETGAGIRLLVDIGTNTEVVLSCAGRLLTCSAPAGPAFEGGQIHHGMRAALGAVEAVEISETFRCVTIGGQSPIGICGSGLIDAVAKMLDKGLIEPSGLLRQDNRDDLPETFRTRFRRTRDGDEYILVPSSLSGHGKDIAITQGDIRNLQLAKGAIYAAIRMLLRAAEVADDEVEEVLLCGGFANHINLDSAARIRMLPGFTAGRARFVGNAAHAGAEITLLSETKRIHAERLARRVEHLSVAEHPEFQDIFVDALQM